MPLCPLYLTIETMFTSRGLDLWSTLRSSNQQPCSILSCGSADYFYSTVCWLQCSYSWTCFCNVGVIKLRTDCKTTFSMTYHRQPLTFTSYLRPLPWFLVLCHLGKWSSWFLIACRPSTSPRCMQYIPWSLTCTTVHRRNNMSIIRFLKSKTKNNKLDNSFFYSFQCLLLTFISLLLPFHLPMVPLRHLHIWL